MFWGQPIDRTAKLGHHQKIQYGRQDGCHSEYYSNSVHSYPREIIFVSIPWFSRLLNTLEQLLLLYDGYIIVKFQVEGVQQHQTLFLINNYSRIHHFKHWQFEWVGQFKWHPCSYNNCYNNCILWATRTKLEEYIAQLQEFESACLPAFCYTIKRNVVTMKEDKKKLEVDSMK